MANFNHLEEMEEVIVSRFEEIKKLADDEVSIDEFDLDGESIRTPKLHSRWLKLLGEEAVNAKKLKSKYDKMYLERWRYYNGTQTDSYYMEHGLVNQKILKTDLSLYINADKFISKMKELIEIQDQIVMFLEKIVKEISQRGYHIKSAIEWRKFQSGG